MREMGDIVSKCRTFPTVYLPPDPAGAAPLAFGNWNGRVPDLALAMAMLVAQRPRRCTTKARTRSGAGAATMETSSQPSGLGHGTGCLVLGRLRSGFPR
jgi:hypothetical protein